MMDSIRTIKVTSSLLDAKRKAEERIVDQQIEGFVLYDSRVLFRDALGENVEIALEFRREL